MTIITQTQQLGSPESEDLLIDAVHANLQVRSLRVPDGSQNGTVRAYADMVGVTFDDAMAEVNQITDQVIPSSKLGASRLDVRKAVAQHIDRLMAHQPPTVTSVLLAGADLLGELPQLRVTRTDVHRALLGAAKASLPDPSDAYRLAQSAYDVLASYLMRIPGSDWAWMSRWSAAPSRDDVTAQLRGAAEQTLAVTR